MKIVAAIAILLIGPLVGILVAVILASFALPPDPSFVSNGGHASPGDGFLIIPYVFFSFFVSVPLSVLLAGIVLFRSINSQKSQQSACVRLKFVSEQFFLAAASQNIKRVLRFLSQATSGVVPATV